MTTVLDAITSAAMAALSTGGATVELEPSGDPDMFPCYQVFVTGWTVIEREADLTRRQLALSVDGYVERGDGQQASAERNALHAAAVAALMTDDTLGGLVELVEDQDLVMHTAVLASSRRLMFGQDFIIEFVTRRNDPALAA